MVYGHDITAVLAWYCFPWELAGLPQICHSVGICPTKNSLKLQPCLALLSHVASVFSFVTYSFILWELVNLPREGTWLFSCFPHGAPHIGTLLIIFVGWLTVSGEPGETEVQEEDHDVTQTEVADGDIMGWGGWKLTQWWLLGSSEVLSSQEMQVGGRSPSIYPYCGVETNPQLVWVGEYFSSLAISCLFSTGAQIICFIDAQ